ncbi:MAG: hypothetical protein KAR47_15925, partial [Planctomycetes bacterium]|nr:hypothetical protein [Planctomycetota bacterium]
ADGEEGYGGAIGLNGGNPTTMHRIKNCLVAGNFAGGGGGGIANMLSASPLIANCTFNDNSSGGFGGGVFDGWASRSRIIDSIFNDCSASAIYAERVGSGTTVQFCLFNDNPHGDLYDELTDVSYDGGAQINSLSGNQGNRDGDPMFIMGGPDGEPADPNVVFGLYYHYYLDQASPAVDSGSTTAENLGLDKSITDINGAFDTGIADMGFHHCNADGIAKYQLTTVSQRDHGIIEPSSGMYYPGTMVRLTAVPDPGYRVVRWYGIDPDDPEKIDYAATFNYGLRSLNNGVLMSADKNIVVEFDQPRTLVVGNVGGDDMYYTSIQHAIDDAQDGDVVMVLPGTYQSTTGRGPLWNITFYGKSIRLSSVNPDDSDTVASTVLSNFYLNIDNVGPDAIVEGFTITRSRTRLFNSDLTIRNCVFTGNNWSGGNGRDGGNQDRDGYDGVDLYGGAIQMYDSSPTILNCVFSDNSASGGDGGDGSNGVSGHQMGWDGGWAGRAYGGAVYCGFTSAPVFRDCVFTNNYARGGDGGHGGNGTGPGNWPGGRGGTWEWAPSYEEDDPYYYYWWWWDGWEFGDKYYEGFTWSNRYDWDLWSQWFHWDKYVSWEDFLLDWTYDFELGNYSGFDPYDSRYDYWEYSGYGGAVYAEYGSSLQFSGCTFENNASYGGVSGIGGTGPGYSTRLPERKFNIETAGGAIYVADGSTVDLANCVVNDNLADTSTDLPAPSQDDPDFYGEGPDDYYVSFGGGICGEDDSAINLTECIISNNIACLGGGIYSSVTDTTIAGTEFADNTAFHGGGLHTIYSNGTITDSVFTGNQANYTAAFRSDGSSDPADGIYGQGGGYYCFSSVVDVIDSVFRKNQATASGGGIYYGGSDQDLDFTPLLINSLVTDNSASRDGGGISVNWFAEPTISNSTIADNSVTGSYGEGTGFGGGLSVAYSTQTTIVNSIIWGNTSDNGAQISVGTGDIYGPMSSILNITHSDIGPAYDPNAIEFDLGGVLAEVTGQSAGGPKLVDAQDVYDQFNAGQATVRVIVSLTDPVASGQATDWEASESVGALRQAVAGSQNSVLSSLTVSEFAVGYVYENQAAFSGEVTIAGLNKLLADPAVSSVEPVRYAES